VLAPVDDAEGTADDAVAAAVADVGLHVDRVELGADDRAGRTGLETTGALAVLADVGHQQPREVAERGLLVRERHRPFHEGDVPPGRGAEVGGVVVRHRSEDLPVVGELVPLLARDLAGLAADAEGGVGEEPLLTCHSGSPPPLPAPAGRDADPLPADPEPASAPEPSRAAAPDAPVARRRRWR